MALISIALIGATAALCSTVFKTKESKVKDVVEFLSLNEGCNVRNYQLKIVSNDINAYLTGVEDPAYHEMLLEIMSRHNKPIGYFSFANNKLRKESDHHIKVTKDSFFMRMKSNKGGVSFFARTAILCVVIYLANDFNGDTNWDITISVFLSVIAGYHLYDWLKNISDIWAGSLNVRKVKEYQDLFDEYERAHASEQLNQGV